MTEMIASAYRSGGRPIYLFGKTRLGKSDEIPAESDSKNDENGLVMSNPSKWKFPDYVFGKFRLEYKLNNITNNSSEESIGSCIGVTSNCIGVVGRRPLDKKNENHCITDEEGDLALSEDIEAKQRGAWNSSREGKHDKQRQDGGYSQEQAEPPWCKGLNAMDKARVAIRFSASLLERT